MKRLFKGTFWNLIVTLLGVAYFKFAPFSMSGWEFWLGLLMFCAIEWVAIAKLREKMRF